MTNLSPSPVLESRDPEAAGDHPRVILVAPNLSERMGGEAIMSLQIYEELVRRGIDVHQVVHARVRDELARRHPDMAVSFVEDDPFTFFLIRHAPLRPLVNVYFMWRAAGIVRRLLREKPGAVVHYTSPVSPALPIFTVPGARVVVGPLNGNIHYPPAFLDMEESSYKARRVLHTLVMRAQRLFFPGKRRADVVLVAGGERTSRAMRAAGCRPERLRDSLNTGIPNRLGDLPRITHEGRNLRFVHNGRLVPHKGVDLILRALPRARLPVELDVIGRGPEREGLEALAKELGLEGRVRFLDWFEDHAELAQALRQYRAFVFPSLAEAHGIVVQEAMMYGLPVVCLDWGGPALLVTPESGITIEPRSREYVIDELAKAMDRLAEDGELAERMSIVGRERALAEGFLWADLINSWLAIYREVLAGRS
jgi:glycosyltransferase involved in cell wall biosynthesis